MNHLPFWVVKNLHVPQSPERLSLSAVSFVWLWLYYIPFFTLCETFLKFFLLSKPLKTAKNYNFFHVYGGVFWTFQTPLLPVFSLCQQSPALPKNPQPTTLTFLIRSFNRKKFNQKFNQKHNQEHKLRSYNLIHFLDLLPFQLSTPRLKLPMYFLTLQKLL